MSSEIGNRADFTQIRYAQCWEDADVLLAALDVQPHHTCLSIASAGENTLALVSKGPRRVIALDLSASQLACLALRVAAYRTLSHSELLALIGARVSNERVALYGRCRGLLGPRVQQFWDVRHSGIAQGIGTLGKFERYLRLFGRRILPLLQSKRVREHVLQAHSAADRHAFYAAHWNNWRWRLIFRIFFSRQVMGWLGRDPGFFDYAEESVAEHLLARTCHAMTVLDPAENPYFQWILLGGRHGSALPYALRPENFEAIRDNLDCLEWHNMSVEAFLERMERPAIDGYNLSDIFEYMSPANYRKLLERIVERGKPGGRLVYWNMIVARSRPESMADQLRSLDDVATRLYAKDKAFFYRNLVVEEIHGDG